MRDNNTAVFIGGLSAGTLTTAAASWTLWRRGARKQSAAVLVAGGVVAIAAAWMALRKSRFASTPAYENPKPVRHVLPATQEEWAMLFQSIPMMGTVTVHDAVTSAPLREVNRVECALNGLTGNLGDIVAWLDLGRALMDDSLIFRYDRALRKGLGTRARAKQWRSQDESAFEPRGFLITMATVPEVGEVFADDCFKRSIELGMVKLRSEGLSEGARDVLLFIAAAAHSFLGGFLNETEGFRSVLETSVNNIGCYQLAVGILPDFPPLLLELSSEINKEATFFGVKFELLQMIPTILNSPWTNDNPQAWLAAAAVLAGDTQTVEVAGKQLGAWDCFSRALELRPSYEAYHHAA
jgi:hypothetical protein